VDYFGLVMTAGDFNGDRIADLVVGAPNRNVNGHTNAGAIYVYPGSATGIRPKKVQILTQDTAGAPGPASDNANFGAVLAVGDFNGDRYGDLAASADQTVGGHPHAGAVDVFYGSSGGLSTVRAQLLTEKSPTDGDNFGAGLAAGRYGDEQEAADGLAVTIGLKQVGPATGAGAVEVLQSGHGRLSPWPTRVYTQNDFPGTRAQKDAGFGSYFGTFDTTLASSSSPF
jgi:FG-GAP repeat